MFLDILSVYLHMTYLRSKKHIENITEAAKLGRIKIHCNNLLKQDEYRENPRLCSNCSTELSYDKRKNKFCSRSCSASYHNKNRGPRSEEVREKIRYSLKQKVRPDNSKTTRVCVQCDKKFKDWPSSDKKLCSKYCAHEYMKTEEYKKVLRDKMLERVSMGLHKGFQVRHKMKPSFAEQYFINVFEKEGFSDQYEREMPIKIKGSMTQFVDFVFHINRIAVEIDGSQHKRPEQIERDKRKDKWLVSNGYKVVRIPWEGVDRKSKIDRLHKKVRMLISLLSH